MNHGISHAMKFPASFILLVTFTILTASAQTPAGTLKIFSENPLVVYVDDVHYPQYGEIKLVPGTHWVKAINGEGERVYSQIVTVKGDEVTSVLIESPRPQAAVNVTSSGQIPDTQNSPAQNPAAQGGGVVFSQTGAGSQPGRSGSTVSTDQVNGRVTSETAAPPLPKPTIDIGQVGGTLPSNMTGAYGLSFGMNVQDVDRIMSPKAAQAQRNNGYYVYAIPTGSSVYLVECRFLDQKLFQIIVGYVSTYTNNSKLKLSKDQVPFPEFNRMLNDVTAIYGSPTTAEKIFLAGYSEDDGRLPEALRKKKALLLYTWTDPATGNNIMVGLGYTTAPLAAAIYTSGPLSAEAASRKIRLHSYSYNIPFKENYFSN